MSLTDEQIDALELCAATKSDIQAIESAACAERDARIAGLERELEEARKDAERYQFAADPQSDGYAVCEWFHDGWIPISTEDLDAAIKEQT